MCWPGPSTRQLLVAATFGNVGSVHQVLGEYGRLGLAWNGHWPSLMAAHGPGHPHVVHVKLLLASLDADE